MKFNIKKYVPPPPPKLGDTRELKRFAWLPVRINNDLVVWLTRYYERQEFKNIFKLPTFSPIEFYCQWETTELYVRD